MKVLGFVQHSVAKPRTIERSRGIPRFVAPGIARQDACCEIDDGFEQES